MDDADIARAKEVLGLPPDETFYVPDEVLELYREAGRRGRERREAWEKRLAGWSGDRAALDAAWKGRGLAGWSDALPTFEVGEEVATRKASGACLKAMVDTVPGLVAGGADLTGNTGTQLDGDSILDRPDGRQIHFGIREHGMGGIMNGMALHGGLLPVGGTFLVFSDYMRGAVRLAALSGAKVVYSWTHDSVGVGEDGPTHQPIEQVSSLRAMPGLRVIRPADARETAAAWKFIVDHDGPTAMILTRQNVPVLEGTGDGLARGGYVLLEPTGDPDVVLIGTGSEVAVCLEAAAVLEGAGVTTRVVSMPCTELFDDQDAVYRASVLLEGVPRLSVEAGTTWGWYRYADAAVGIDRFGASAPGEEVMAKLGIEPAHVAERALALLSE
jgi:transketolase